MDYGKQSGYALLEAMIGLFVLGVGLLGMASLQNQAVRISNSAHLYSQASYLASDMVERIRANREKRDDYNLLYSDTITATTDCGTSGCTSAQLIKWDQSEWLDDLANQLPQGDGAIVINGNTVTIQVRFDDDMGGQSAAQSSQASVKDGLVQLQLDSQI
ncbi:type IV pilus modification protein PilV [Aestuariicella sp. G3-2]|uniref:type IV pilus modification protein PilV n=1 Tax=Pseudomaricurvus albidus TaxID=2842452 RepID=UPI001C0E352D|nr:type IV pilus modification protein PilV [Aestuariicella albida]MBU3070681.1 type IV pilus modification protein PilV [Aestuariicella albida]